MTLELEPINLNLANQAYKSSDCKSLTRLGQSRSDAGSEVLLVPRPLLLGSGCGPADHCSLPKASFCFVSCVACSSLHLPLTVLPSGATISHVVGHNWTSLLGSGAGLLWHLGALVFSGWAFPGDTFANSSGRGGGNPLSAQPGACSSGYQTEKCAGKIEL